MWTTAAVIAAWTLGQLAPDAGEPPLPEDAGVVEPAPEVPQEAVDADVFDAGVPLQRETTVTERRIVDVRRVAGSAQVIGKEELERQEANDLNRVVQGVPGVYVREEDGFGLRPNIGIRGANADRSSKVTLMEDGVLFGPAPYSAPAAYYTPLLTRMVGVEVYKGPAAIRFGPQTIGGALNLRTREAPRQFESDIDVSLGSYGAAKGHGIVGYGTERWGVLLEGVHLQSDGFKQLDGGGDTGFDKNELMLKGRYTTDPTAWARHEFQLKLGFANERSYETYLGLSNEDFAATPLRRYASSANDQMNWWRTQVALSHTLNLGERFELVTTVYRHDFARTWRRFDQFRNGPQPYTLLAYPATGTNAIYAAILRGTEDTTERDQQLILADNERTFVSQGVQSVGTITFGTGPLAHELEFGVRFHHDQIDRHHTGHAYDLLRGTLVAVDEEGIPLADNTAFTRSVSAHLADTMSLGGLLIAPGARVEIFDAALIDSLGGTRSSSLSVVPLVGLGAVYTFDFGLSVLGGVHQGFSPPTPGQVGALPERAINSEFGLRYGRHGVRLEAIGFWSEYQNITGECTGSSGCVNDVINQQFNGGTARLLGVEVLASLRKKVGWGLSGAAELSYTFTNAVFLSSFVSDNPSWGRVQAGAELPYVPAHQGSLRLRAAKGPVELGIGGVYYGQVRELAGVGEPDPSVLIPHRFLLDATASVQLGDARFYLTVTNLTNQASLVARRPFGARPQAPLIAQVGFKYSFR